MLQTTLRQITSWPIKIVFTGPSTPWIPLGFHVPIAFSLLSWNLLGDCPSPGTFLGLFASGLFLWTLIEYLMHALAFHGSSNAAPLRAMRFMHGEHHDDPTNPAHIFVRPARSIPPALVVWGLSRLVLPSWQLAALPVAGVGLGYLSYELIHYAIHRWPRWRWIRPLVSHHLHHHYADPSSCYGVTCPLWDMVFGTGRRIPEKMLAERRAAG